MLVNIDGPHPSNILYISLENFNTAARWGHASVLVDSKIYIFGGYHDTKREHFQDMWVFDLSRFIQG